MKSSILLVLIGFVGLVAVSQATDYCSKDLCGEHKHIACNNPGNFATSCPADRQLVPIEPYIPVMVRKHNQLRNKLALGNLTGFEPCPRMATIEWNNELAHLAEMNVKTCKFEHDECHNTDEFHQSGQNLAISWSSEKFTNSIKATILQLIDSWWSEYKEATMKQIRSYPAYNKKPMGHFAVIARGPNHKMGCACATYRNQKMNMYTLLLACNYATTNIMDGEIYSSGKTASKCKTGINLEFKGLCSKKEQY